jgi:hypothetical protein
VYRFPAVGQRQVGLPLGVALRSAGAVDSRLERSTVGSVIKKRRKRMAKKKHRKLLKKTRIQRRRQGK